MEFNILEVGERPEKNKQIITVISGGKCCFRNKQDYVIKTGKGATFIPKDSQRRGNI